MTTSKKRATKPKSSRRSPAAGASLHFLSRSEKETFKKGKEFARTVKPGDVIGMFGELGSGKSVFTRGVLHGLGIQEKYIASPTFTLINVYQGKLPVYHFDVYRLEGPDELDGLGYEEFFFGDGVAIVEWADKVENHLPRKYIKVSLKVVSENGRLVTITHTR
jgi:tRNA threonylcarbamoyladenosine biosynthesis protein TsaE